mgnify:CR=1 FL=1|jgi:hypothetical protein
MKKQDDFNFEEIEAQVVEYIPTPHGRIGIIIPDNEPTEEQLDQLYKTIADAIIESTDKKRSAT